MNITAVKWLWGMLLFEIQWVNMTYFSVLQLPSNTVTVAHTKGAIVTLWLLSFNFILSFLMKYKLYY